MGDCASSAQNPELAVPPCDGCKDLDCPVKNLVGEHTPSHCAGAVKRLIVRSGQRLGAAYWTEDTILRFGSGLLMQEQVLGDSRRHVAAFFAGGDLCWPKRPGPDSDIREYYEAILPTDLCIISVEELPLDDPKASTFLKTLYSSAKDEVRRTQRLMLSLARSSAQQRLAEFLGALAAKIGTRTERGLEVRLSMRRERIADHLGMQPETISRLMSGFKKSGVIVLPRPSHVIIPNRDRLRDIAIGRT